MSSDDFYIEENLAHYLKGKVTKDDLEVLVKYGWAKREIDPVSRISRYNITEQGEIVFLANKTLSGRSRYNIKEVKHWVPTRAEIRKKAKKMRKIPIHFLKGYRTLFSDQLFQRRESQEEGK